MITGPGLIALSATLSIGFPGISRQGAAEIHGVSQVPEATRAAVEQDEEEKDKPLLGDMESHLVNMTAGGDKSIDTIDFEQRSEKRGVGVSGPHSVRERPWKLRLPHFVDRILRSFRDKPLLGGRKAPNWLTTW
ncbi:hypothetical protein B0H63DRAFT_529575 [Podospora didyma]|uniref:Uncharacterized protein n=1 Tax=Podospora didyma TaxID=330526 RepID=A0AAE0K1F6_9PEZI|nr:hypothetical protein B0H63DRAFT_529575 [Podospora didyma]